MAAWVFSSVAGVMAILSTDYNLPDTSNNPMPPGQEPLNKSRDRDHVFTTIQTYYHSGQLKEQLLRWSTNVGGREADATTKTTASPVTGPTVPGGEIVNNTASIATTGSTTTSRNGEKTTGTNHPSPR